MDNEGYLPITLIAGFPRVRNLTLDIDLIKLSLKDSDKVELSPEELKVRPRITPEQWPLSPTVPTISAQSPHLSTETFNEAQTAETGNTTNVVESDSEHTIVADSKIADVCEKNSSAVSDKPETPQQPEKPVKGGGDENENEADNQTKALEDEPDEWHQVKTKRGKKNRGGGGNYAANSEHSYDGKAVELDFQFDEEMDGKSKEKDG